MVVVILMTYSISAGATTGTVNFTPTDDSTYEGNETATISINGVSGKTGVAENSTPQAVTITITENESSPTITLTSSSSICRECWIIFNTYCHKLYCNR